MPRAICICQYYANFIGDLNAFHKIASDFQTYKNFFFFDMQPKTVYLESVLTVWVFQLKGTIGKISFNSAVKWKVWKENLYNMTNEWKTKKFLTSIEIEEFFIKFDIFGECCL